MKLSRFILSTIAFLLSFSIAAPLAASASGPVAYLTIGYNKKCDYQIVIPDSSGDVVVDGWLILAAKFTQAVFAKQGFTLPIKTESYKLADKPALYLGATQFAKANGIDVEPLDDWTYFQKVVGHDVIIAGRDIKDPALLLDRHLSLGNRTLPLARLGTLKGVCDFLRQYAGVRFLFMNSESGGFPDGNIEAKRVLDETPLRLDTRSVAILPLIDITVPSDLNVQKKPLMLACADIPRESLYLIANNYFPQLGSLQGGQLSWYEVVPSQKYAKTHPEYFALNSSMGGRNVSPGNDYHNRFYCPSNEEVHKLLVDAVKQQIAAGHKYIHFVPFPNAALTCCNCGDCQKFFGSNIDVKGEGRSRGPSGKVWQIYFKITEHFRTSHPHVRFIITSGPETPISADIIKRFPENVIPQISIASQRDLDKLAGVECPAGICGIEQTFTEKGKAGAFIAERTPAHMAEFVQTLVRNKVLWTTREQAFGSLRGLTAPACYVYGRMMDDPTADWETLMDEFCHAAFGAAVDTMGQFFHLFHTQMAFYSDILGVGMPWDSDQLRTRYQDSKWHLTTIYTPEFCTAADSLLKAAESETKDPDVLARLQLIRIEFDYARQLANIFHLQNEWTIAPTQENLNILADAIDSWRADLQKLTSGSYMKFVPPNWYEMKLFGGHTYRSVSLEGIERDLGDTCLNWDTNALRAGVLDDKHDLKVATVTTEPAIDSTEWDKVAPSYFRLHDGIPSSRVATSMKVLHDTKHLYVRLESKNPSMSGYHTPVPPKPDGNIFMYDWVEVALTPPNDSGKVYRIAVNLKEDSRFDAVYKLNGEELVEDLSWNGTWTARHHITGRPQDLSEKRVWIVLFKIPFSDFINSAPDSDHAWSFNVGRGHNMQRALWLDTPNGTPIKALGKLKF